VDTLEEQSSITKQLNNGEQYAMINGNIIATQKYFANP
jgi:hypothetical protein